MKDSNSFLKDVTPMCANYPAVRHAIYALASTYILDYEPSEQVEAMAERHHQLSVKSLGQMLLDANNYAPGKEDPLLATIFLLSHGDVCASGIPSSTVDDIDLARSLSIGNTATKRRSRSGR